MTKKANHKQYDLEDRTEQFAKDVRTFVKKLIPILDRDLIAKEIR